MPIFKKRGRNVATREDIDRVFRLLEEMRAQVSGRLWEAQERWRFKADYYGRLLQNLGEQERLASVRLSTIDQRRALQRPVMTSVQHQGHRSFPDP